MNQCTSTASKVDPDNWNVEFTKAVGQNPYTQRHDQVCTQTITAPVGVYEPKSQVEGCSNRLGSRIDATMPGNGLTWLDVYYRFGSTEEALRTRTGKVQYPPDNFPLELGVTANHMEIELRFYTDEPTVLPVLHALKVIAFKECRPSGVVDAP